MWRPERPRRRGDESGFTTLEVVIAATILVVAMSVFLAGLARTQRNENFTTYRTRALDDLRIAANTFARDMRNALRVTSFDAAQKDSITVQQYVGTSATPVTTTYHVVTIGGELHLQRVRGTAVRTFVVDLTDSAVLFPDDELNLELVRRVKLRLTTRPLQDYPPVSLDTEVAMRNAPG